jgi:phytoene dehydrogenase-like protein
LSGGYRDVARAEDAVSRGRIPERPFILFVQPTVADPSRAPEGKHIGWAYCHVPNGSTVDLTDVLEREVERHAPGFRDLIVARSVMDAPAMEAYDANYVGGDINGGAQDLWQALFRPVVRWDPYSTPLEGVFLCSSSTPPGGGVHGMSGWHAARSALRRIG